MLTFDLVPFPTTQVKSQVESQIKVRDLSAAKVSIEPADATSWSEVRNSIISERKASLATELETKLSAMSDPDMIESTRTEFKAREKAIEAEVDSKVHNFSMAIDVDYNVRNSRDRTHPSRFHLCFLTRVFVSLYSSSPSKASNFPDNNKHDSLLLQETIFTITIPKPFQKRD
jgi:hypothetical protein